MQTETTPSKATVAAALQEALAALLAAEQAVLEATAFLLSTKRDLQDAEDVILRRDPPLLDGKNEAIRAAQLRDLTYDPCRRRVERAEWERIKAASALEGARATFSAQKLLARLLAGEDR